MSVLSHGREKGYPKSSWEYDGKKTVHTVRDREVVLVDSDDDVDDLIMSQLPFQVGDAFAGSAFDPPLLTGIALDRDPKARRQWYIDLSYTPLTDQDIQSNQTSPDLRLPEWSWDFESIERVCSKDTDGLEIVNSVGEPIILSSPWVIPVLNIERYELTFDPSVIVAYVNHRNTSSFWGAQAGQALMGGIRDRRDTQEVWQGFYFRKVSYCIKFAVPFVADAMEGWTDLVLNRANYYVDSNTFDLVHFRDARGNLIQGNIDTSGLPLPTGQAPMVLRFNTKAEAEFNALNLGPY
jgi:hypothetical protein